MDVDTNKSRDLSLADYYEILQKEYISYHIRAKVYPEEYANKYRKYCVCKREKIEKISNKNGLPSIFNLMSLRQRFFDEFFNLYGLPNFEYRDEKSRHIMGRWDKEYWFGTGVSIKVKTEDEILVVTVHHNITYFNRVVVNLGGELEQFDYRFITRIITDNMTDL